MTALSNRSDIEKSLSSFKYKFVPEIINHALTHHGNSVKGGWWTDLKTGEDMHESRNRLALVALVITELSESYLGIEGKLMDDKLPEYPMYDVENADAMIRIYDLIGAEITLHGSGLVEYLADSGIEDSLEHLDHTPLTGETDDHVFLYVQRQNTFIEAVNRCSEIIEDYRKNRTRQAVEKLIELVFYINIFSYDLSVCGESPQTIIDAKAAFNAKRADHKPENRKKEGGKAL